MEISGPGRRTVVLGLAVGVVAPGLASAQDKPRTIVSHGIAIHGEPGYAADTPHFPFVDPKAPKGGSVRLGARGTFDSLNPFILKGVAAAGIGQIYLPLMANSADEASTEYGMLAETIEYPGDRSWAIFTLRPQARWHDGQPVTAEDVVFTLDILKTKASPQYAFYYADVIKAEALGERRVKFTFKAGENRELPVIIGQLMVLPRHWWATREFDKTTLEVPLGCGPYRVEAFEPGRQITYRRVADWWAKDLWLTRGRYNFDVIRYDYYRDASVVFEAFKSGDIDFRQENTARLWATAYEFLAVKAGTVKRDEIRHELPAGMQCFAFNQRREPFKDRRVREAIAALFDFEWSNRNLFHGFYRRNVSFFGNSELASTGLPSKEELELLEPLRADIPAEVFTHEFQPPATDGSGNIRDQARHATALLKAAGFEVKAGKMSHVATGKPLAFEMLLGDGSFERIVLPYKQNLEKIGVEMRVRTVDSAQFKAREDDFDFDMMVDGFGQSLSPGNEQRDFWSSGAADRKGSRNTTGIRNPAIDKLIDLLIAAPDRKALIARTRALDRVLLWGHYVVPAWHLGRTWIAYWDRFGRPSKTARYQPVSFDAWWIDETRDKALRDAGARK